MIDSKILKSLTSRETDIGYTLLITGYEQKQTCNSESIEIKMHQINKKISEIESDTTPVEKTLVVQSALDINDDNGLMITKLIGNSNIKGQVQAIQASKSYNSHYMEMVNTTLDKSIEIQFGQSFYNIPAINITMDEKTRALFSDYTLNFEKKEDDDTYYKVTITFLKLKRRQNYPEINILIIGDKFADTSND